MAGLLVGGLIGAGLALAFAPRNGREMRRGVAAWREARRKERPTNGTVAEIKDLGCVVVEAGRERVLAAMQAARSARSEARASITREWDQAKRGNGLG